MRHLLKTFIHTILKAILPSELVESLLDSLNTIVNKNSLYTTFINILLGNLQKFHSLALNYYVLYFLNFWQLNFKSILNRWQHGCSVKCSLLKPLKKQLATKVVKYTQSHVLDTCLLCRDVTQYCVSELNLANIYIIDT